MQVRKIADLDSLIQQLKPYLRRYLEERNVDIKEKGQFSCIHPSHVDKHPSCGFVKNTEERQFYCFTCCAKGDIFTAAHFLESKPLSGEGFIKDNVMYLAEKYGIAFSEIKLTPEEMRIRRVYQAYEDAADVVSEYQPVEYVTKRKWPISLCRDLDVGSVRSYDDFIKKMSNRGYEKQFIEEVDLNRFIFNEGMLIFSVRDKKGRVVGFSARNMSHSKESKRAKFINTSAKCPIYNKSAILYGLNISKKEKQPLYIFEGYPDFVTAYKYNMRDICAIGGTALTREHIDTLKSLNINDCILALDGDKAGQDRIESLLDSYFGGDETMRVRILKLPEKKEECDPDDFIEKNGVDRFKGLPRLTPFQWRLERFRYDANPDYICDKMMPFIVMDPNEVHRETMAKELAERTSIRLKTILKQLDKLINVEEARLDSHVQFRIRQMVEDLNKGKADPIYLLESTAEEIREMHQATNEDVHSNKEMLIAFDELKDTFATRKPGLQGLKSGFSIFDETISGIPKEDVMITFAGDSNVGKCKKFDTKILLSDGSYKTIEDVYNKKIDYVMTMDKHKIIPSKVSAWVDSGKLECFKIETKSGLLDESSSTHPYYTVDGWKKVTDLVPGDKIAVPKNYRMSLNSDVEEWQSILLGFLLSDGSITRGVGFCNVDMELVDIYKKIIVTNFGPEYLFREENCTTYTSKKGSTKNEVIGMLKKFGVYGKNSHNKFIPDSIFKSSNHIISVFLGAFFACDGWVCKRTTENNIEIGLTLCNELMLRQINSLLLRLGIKAIIRKGKSLCNGKYFDRFSISILDKQNIMSFYNNIEIPLSHKQNMLENFCKSDAVLSRGSYISNFPSSLWEYIAKKCDNIGIDMSDLLEDVCGVVSYFCKERNKVRTKKHNISFYNNINPMLLKKIAYRLEDEFLISLCDGDICFDKITKIEPIGKHQCYDLTVSGTHNFIANDIIVHNTGFMFQLALDLAKSNDNIAVLFMSIDDSRQQALARLVALESGLRINQIAHPKENIKNAEEKEKLDEGWRSIRGLIRENKFLLKDNAHGNTLDFAEGWIRWAKENLPSKDIVFFLDNFHKLGDEWSKDERIRFKHASARMHAMKNKLHFTAICTMEIRKLTMGQKNQRPMLQDISESKQMEYDNNLIGMIYSDMHARRDAATVFWTDNVDEKVIRKPVIEIDIQKNKISEYKDVLYYKFSPEYSKFYECGRDEVGSWGKEYDQAMRSIMDKKNPEGGDNPFISSNTASVY